MDLEVGLVDGWVRYWYQGKLLLLPAELQHDLDESRQQAEQARQQADQAHQQITELMRQLAEERQARKNLERQLSQSRRQSERKPRRNGGS